MIKITESTGSINKLNDTYYGVCKGGQEYCHCPTYEEAFFYKRELQKNNWDKNKIPEIKKEFPKYYTMLLYFYKYITIDKRSSNWIISIPKKFNVNHKLELISYKKLEDALFERDFLVEHGWDYELLVEAIDDTKNPYYDMDLPPYPKKKIRNIRNKGHDKIIGMIPLIKNNPSIRISEMAAELNIATETVRQRLKKYNLSYLEFKSIVLNNNDPLSQLKSEPVIYTPSSSSKMNGDKKNETNYIT